MEILIFLMGFAVGILLYTSLYTTEDKQRIRDLKTENDQLKQSMEYGYTFERVA